MKLLHAIPSYTPRSLAKKEDTSWWFLYERTANSRYVRLMGCSFFVYWF